MDQIMINGYEWIRLNDMCDILRAVVKDNIFENSDKVVNLIAHMMFYDEHAKAETDEEREAALELPGDFVVCKDLGYKNPNGKRFIFFMEFSDGEGKAIDNGEKAMHFKYESMAEKVAEKLGGGGWRVMNVGIESGRMTERFLKAFLGEDGYEELHRKEKSK